MICGVMLKKGHFFDLFVRQDGHSDLLCAGLSAAVFLLGALAGTQPELDLLVVVLQPGQRIGVQGLFKNATLKNG